MTPFRLWVYLQTTPLFWLTATLAAFLVADALARAAHRHPLVNPVAIAIALLGALLKLTGADYQTYFNGAQFVHFLLGPATVALGVPIYTNLALVKRNFWPLVASLAVGAIVADMPWRSGSYTSPLTQRQCSKTASFRATATAALFFAFFPPRSQSRSPYRRKSVSGPNGPKI